MASAVRGAVDDDELHRLRRLQTVVGRVREIREVDELFLQEAVPGVRRDLPQPVADTAMRGRNDARDEPHHEVVDLRERARELGIAGAKDHRFRPLIAEHLVEHDRLRQRRDLFRIVGGVLGAHVGVDHVGDDTVRVDPAGVDIALDLAHHLADALTDEAQVRMRIVCRGGGDAEETRAVARHFLAFGDPAEDPERDEVVAAFERERNGLGPGDETDQAVRHEILVGHAVLGLPELELVPVVAAEKRADHLDVIVTFLRAEHFAPCTNVLGVEIEGREIGLAEDVNKQSVVEIGHTVSGGRLRWARRHT